MSIDKATPEEWDRASAAVLAKKQETDPTGRKNSDPGAKVDAGKVELSLITQGMARALRAVASVATFGAKKYSRGGWVEVPDGFYRYSNAQERHANDRGRGETIDPDSGELHLAHEAWNALAKLDLYLRQQEQITKDPA